ncbi:hypothetical protein QA641_29570 [Bradyrhizobium sp. CB1650]|uniref:hypothetical protein n=1 Tax=Bradyrhizobium sp. CB1650 TaxID=3039153 RepID=UPI0024347F74|nr:hypothetical protein [Bradyrhizobium sp. CB1650]WGD49763.1 hypothetical protein QA641_29570 [Bradyrhizobium sp. CB1650]
MGSLAKYKNERLVITPVDAQRVLLFFFHRLPPGLDDNDRRFAQALILAAAEATAEIGILERLWRSASSPTAKPMGILKDVAKSVLKYLGRPRKLIDAIDAPNYTMVVNSIAYGYSGAWQARIQTDDSSLLM